MKRFLLILFSTFLFSGTIEKLDFAVYFNELKAGNASLILSDDAQGLSYIINFELRSNKYLDFIYKLRENTSMLVNKKDFSIYEIQKYIRQGRRKKSYHATFDYDLKIAHINNAVKIFEYPVYDPINIIYYLRNNFNTLNNHFSFSVISKNNFKNISMGLIGNDTIQFNNKDYKCIVLGPDNKQKLEHLENIKIWFSDDSLRLPLIIEKRAKLGVIKMELESIENYE